MHFLSSEKITIANLKPAAQSKKFAAQFKANDSKFYSRKKSDGKKEIISTRPVKDCCDGYEPISALTKTCVPVCKGEHECQNGTCVAPKVCDCGAGFMGKICNESESFYLVNLRG
jgi:hypothetical protein